MAVFTCIYLHYHIINSGTHRSNSPHKSPVGVKFKFSNEHSWPFHMGSPPQVSKCLTGSEGVKLPTTTTWKIINVFQVKNEMGSNDFKSCLTHHYHQPSPALHPHQPGNFISLEATKTLILSTVSLGRFSLLLCVTTVLGGPCKLSIFSVRTASFL